MSVRITYFVHGTTTDNEQDLGTGWLPGELSPRGIAQSKELPSLVAGQQFETVFCSDLKRAVDSARIAFATTHTIIEDARLRECNYGDLNGAHINTFKDRLNELVEVPFPHGESYRDVEVRISSFLDHLREKYEGKHIAIVAHQGPQLALDVLLRGRTWEGAIEEDWRKTKSWQPGWEYLLP